MIQCKECEKPVEGEARVIGDSVLHVRCAKAHANRLAGRPCECPVCNGAGQWHEEAHIHDRTQDPGFGYSGEGGPGDCRSFREFIPAKNVVCGQCHGHGYVAKEPRQVPTGMKWVTE